MSERLSALLRDRADYAGLYGNPSAAEFLKTAALEVEELESRVSEAEARAVRCEGERDRLRAFARDIATNFDHDSDAHRYNTPCRVCEAEKLLA